MRVLCARACCSDESQHIAFLNLQPVVVLPTCCNCYLEVNERCKLVQELLLYIQKYTLPATTLWSEEFIDPQDMLLPDCMCLIVHFLLHLLEQLEASITSSYAPVVQIQNAVEMINRNLEFIKPLSHHECDRSRD